VAGSVPSPGVSAADPGFRRSLGVTVQDLPVDS
jgi:hypothetical protein